jgi:HAMP domain-containing protein
MSSAKYQYDHQNPEDIVKTELRELAEQIEEKRREIRRSV